MAGLHNAAITYKNRAIKQILHDPEILSAFNSRYDSPDDLIYKNIFPYFRIPNAITETGTYITVCVDFPETYHPENVIRDVVLKFCIIVHQDQMQTEFGATRLDYIAAKIEDLFSESTGYGIGKLYVASSIESSLDQFHRYREIMFASNAVQANC